MIKPTIKSLITRTAIASAVPALVLSFASCEVKKTEEGEMPEVKVEGGNVPEYDVEGPDVKVEEKKVEIPDSITVPDIDIVTPEEKRAGGNVEDGAVETETPAADATPAADM